MRARGGDRDFPMQLILIFEEVFMKTRIAIITAEFNGSITKRMERIAEMHAESIGVSVARKINVPGVYDLPLAAKKMLKLKDIDAVVVLGAVVQGGTSHDEVIANSTAKALAELSLEFEKPVALGISGPRMTMQQAEERAGEYAKNAVNAAAKLV